MTLKGNIEKFYEHPDIRHRLSYRQLQASDLDIGFVAEVVAGKNYHHITRDFVISLMQFKNGIVSSMTFQSPSPVRLDLTESDIAICFSDFLLLRYVISGKIAIEIEGTSTNFFENELFIVSQDAGVRELVSDSEGIVLNICISQRVLNESFLTGISLNPLQKFLRENLINNGNKNKFLRFSPEAEADLEILQEDLNHILLEGQRQETGYIDICRGYILRLMDRLTEMYRLELSKEQNTLYTDKLFEAVEQYMTDHLRDVSMTDLSEQFHYQNNYFNKLIRKYTGRSYSEHLIFLRIKCARLLLETTKLTVEEIAWMIGYNNRGFFNKKFYEATGMTPAAYRESNN